jgi:hypothetical protein
VDRGDYFSVHNNCWGNHLDRHLINICVMYYVITVHDLVHFKTLI